jgi:hypothetical protein
MNEIFVDISSDRDRILTYIVLLRNKSHLTGSTLERRTRTIVSWVAWIRNNLGIVEVDHAGNVRIDRQTRFPKSELLVFLWFDAQTTRGHMKYPVSIYSVQPITTCLVKRNESSGFVDICYKLDFIS